MFPTKFCFQPCNVSKQNDHWPSCFHKRTGISRHRRHFSTGWTFPVDQIHISFCQPAGCLQQASTTNQGHVKRKTRNAASYVRVRYDPRTICKLSDLLRRNHKALLVSFQQNFQQFLRYFYHQPVERAELLRDLAPLALPNQECKLCGITAWLHMVRVDWWPPGGKIVW